MKSRELTNKKVVIMPFNTEAIFLYHQLIRDGVEVAAFMDADPSLHNSAYKGTMIIPYFHFEGNDVVAIIATLGYVSDKEILKELLNVNYVESEILRQEEIEFDCHIEDITEDIDLSGLSKIRNLYWMKLLKTKIYKYTVKDGLLIPAIGLHVTTRCTLRCNGCGELMDYFRPKDRRDMRLEGIIQAFDSLMAHLDFVEEVLPIGGETFLYKDLDKLLEYITSSRHVNRIGQVVLFTNGTILPSLSVLEILGNNRHLFQIRISDYGSASLKKRELITLLNQNNCNYINVARDSWYLHNRPTVPASNLTIEEIWKKCSNCICRGDGMLRVIENKVYNCIFVAMATECHAIPYDKRNYIDLNTDSISKETLRKFVEEVHPGMAYCSGTPLENNGNQIILPIGEQTSVVQECVRYDE